MHAPDKCPFCGAALTGGGDRTAYYACGAHIWIEPHGSEYECTLKGHQGLCKEVVLEDIDPEHAEYIQRSPYSGPGTTVLTKEVDERGLVHIVYKKEDGS